MAYLIANILILLLLSAALGGGLVYWWFRNKYEDVTESYATYRRKASDTTDQIRRTDLDQSVKKLMERLDKLDKDPDLSPLDSQFASLKNVVSGIEIPETDLSALESRLFSIEERLEMPDQTVEGLRDHVGQLEGKVAQILSAVNMLHNADFSGVEGELDKVADRLDTVELKLDNADQPSLDEMATHFTGAFVEAAPKVDLSPLERRLLAVEQSVGRITFPKLDLSPVLKGLTRVEQSVGQIKFPETDLSPVTTGLTKVEEAVGNIPRPEKPDLTPVHQSIETLEGRISAMRESLSTARQSELDSIRAGFAALTKSVSAIPAPDLEPVLLRLRGLESTVSGIQPIEARLTAVQDAIAGHRQPDLNPILASIRSVDTRRDLASLENRLNAIEYGLAAIHHTLRANAESRGSNGGEQLFEINAPGNFSQIRTQSVRLVERPPREADPINAVRREDDHANLIMEPAFGDQDDLTLISGVGPMLNELLNDIGVYYLWQIAEWSEEEIDWVDSKLLHFSGRIKRDDWVGQAIDLAQQPHTATRPSPASSELGSGELA